MKLLWFMEVFEDLTPEIVPGVSSFNCANAALKKSVAAGEKTRSIALSNGMDMEELAKAKTSMVFFTMHLSLQEIVSRLKPYYGGDMPIAIVGNAGYRDRECIYQGTLDTILDKTKGKDLPVHLVYVGDFLTKRYGIKEAEKGLTVEKNRDKTDTAAMDNQSGKPGLRIPPKQRRNKPLILSEWNMPMPVILGNRQLDDKLKAINITTKNSFGMVRKFNIIQCNQFHTRPSLEDLQAQTRKKEAQDRKLSKENKEKGSVMCLGMVSGYLAAHYAIHKMYGDNIPDIEDFTLGSNCPMAGLWDSLNLVCAKNLKKGDPSTAPSRGEFSFTVTRMSDGRTITFAFTKEYQKKFERFFDMKRNPKKYKDVKRKIQQLQEEMDKSLLERFAEGDYGYFRVL